MDSLMFAVLFVLLIFICIKNVSMTRRYKHNAKYIETYKKVIHNEENSYDAIKKYIEEEKSLEFKNKAYIIKLFSELDNGKEYIDTAKSIDFKEILYVKGKLDNNQIKLNSDSFIFVILDIAKAYEKGNKDAIEILSEKINEIEGLDNRVEYATVNAFIKAIRKDGDLGTPFMKNLLDGNYTEYQYDKNMIGLYKRTAAATLAFGKEEFDEFFRNDLHSFSKTFIGECLLKSLGIYEEYKPIEEEIEEENKEENK